jgi:cytochrome c oxidase subunit III
MTPRPLLDVSQLPDHTFGSRDPMWWGVVLLIGIEGTMMVLLGASYFVFRGNFDVWPPTDPGPAARRLAVIGLIVLIGSAAPAVLANRAARDKDLPRLRRWLCVLTALGLGFCALRVFELRAIPFRWSSHAYGSLFWTTAGLHTFHLVTGVLENLVFAVLAFTRRFEPKHFVDSDLNGLFWLFVVIEWLPLCALFYGDGVLLGH